MVCYSPGIRPTALLIPQNTSINSDAAELDTARCAAPVLKFPSIDVSALPGLVGPGKALVSFVLCHKEAL